MLPTKATIIVSNDEPGDAEEHNDIHSHVDTHIHDVRFSSTFGFGCEMYHKEARQHVSIQRL